MKQLNGLVIFLLGLLIVFVLSRFVAKKPKAEQAIRKVILRSDYKELLPYVIAQSKHETNNFQSPLYIRANNLFGMTDATKRVQLGQDVKNEEYRYYKNDIESVEDLVLYFDYWNFPKKVDSIQDYVRILKSKNYFTDLESNYLKGLLKWV